MSFDLQALRARLQAQGPVVRVVVAGVAGSAPREAGASMLVWAEGQEGTIGGGALEFTAITQARAMLAQGRTARLDRLPLGPVMGQCCGGAVVLLFNSAAIMAMLRHYREDRDFMYGLDIKFLDEAREARKGLREARNGLRHA